MKIQTVLVTLTALSACALTTAHADSIDQPPSRPVQFSAFDTSSAQGTARLFLRLKSAAETVCSKLDARGSLEQKTLLWNCVHAAVGRAVMQINQPVLTSYAASRGVAVTDRSTQLAQRN
jgi:UrcA family protein